MKKFIAPEVKVVRYDTGVLCASVTIGKDIEPGETVEFDAPGRRRSIFDDTETASPASPATLK